MIGTTVMKKLDTVTNELVYHPSYFPHIKQKYLKSVYCLKLVCAQPAITWSRLTIETLEQGVKYVQSQQ